MPVVILVNGYKFKFFSNENDGPPHIHVTKGGGEAKYWLSPSVEEVYSYGFTVRERREIREFVLANSTLLIEKWNGMTTSDNEIVNKPSKDPLDQLIFEQGLRIKKLFFDIELDLMLVLLTNRRVLNLKLSSFKRLASVDPKAPEQLTNYSLENNGTAVSWESLDEDLSIRGFIKQAALEETLYNLAKVS